MSKEDQYYRWSTVDIINLFSFDPLIILKQNNILDYARPLNLVVNHRLSLKTKRKCWGTGL